MKHALLALISVIMAVGCSSKPVPEPENEMNVRLMELQAQQQEMLERQRALEQQARQDELDILPDWVESPPDADATGFYGVGIAQSKALNHSRRAARLLAEFELATQYRNEISGSERSFEESRASGDVNTQTTFLIDRIIDAVPVVGYQIVDQQIKAHNGQFFTYVLLKLPYDQFNAALQQQREAETDSRVQAQFDDLERRLTIRRQEREEAAQREHERDIERIEARTRALNNETRETAEADEVGTGGR
ncbi:hypothetical protein [Aliidiomarina quisquiliarum]|uniref:hypothetical protein n=1 Tax=Aliidiomarina quisquiliarum TaxID=2938947 RepID=UPI00208FEA23|nr:hypothetical protein [Aliidiomarina quisquiliarum]MCO4319891.1 hypothetical protein [Aliidiomarina quisquiliarum]